MGIFDRGTTALQEQLADLQEQLHGEVAQNDWLQESLADLELAIDDEGWARLSLETEWEFSRDGLDRIVALSRLNALKNPLIRRAVHVKANYVFGQGVEISARDEQVNDVVQQFLDDPGNQAELFAASARLSKDRALTTDGNVVFVLFPNALTGHLSVRSVPVEEIRDVICNPNDRKEPWFYLRRWTERDWSVFDGGFGERTIQREAWYPDWRYQPGPGQRVESIMRIPVRWGTPIYHVAVGGLDGMRFGVPETYAALDWAKAYKLFLEDWATIVRSLSRFAWSLTVKKNPSAAARRIGSTATVSSAPTDGNPSPTTGSVFAHTDGADLKAIPKTDAVIDAESGVPLAKMVAAATDVPYTILMGDADMGNLATAKTLDRPTELAMMGRQDIWKTVIADLAGCAVDWAIRSPGGDLDGDEARAPDGRTVWVLDDVEVPNPEGQPGDTRTMTGVERRTIDVTFPPLTEHDIREVIQAIVQANSTGFPAPKLILRLLLTALGVDDVDEHIAVFDEEFEDRQRKELEMQTTIGDLAVRAARAGDDPADAIK